MGRRRVKAGFRYSGTAVRIVMDAAFMLLQRHSWDIHALSNG